MIATAVLATARRGMGAVGEGAFDEGDELAGSAQQLHGSRRSARRSILLLHGIAESPSYCRFFVPSPFG
jgi:hypothetical protein